MDNRYEWCITVIEITAPPFNQLNQDSIQSCQVKADDSRVDQLNNPVLSWIAAQDTEMPLWRQMAQQLSHTDFEFI